LLGRGGRDLAGTLGERVPDPEAEQDPERETAEEERQVLPLHGPGTLAKAHRGVKRTGDGRVLDSPQVSSMLAISPPSPPNLYGLDRDGLARVLSAYGAPAFHAGQVFRWLYARRSFDPAAWSDLPRALRTRLAEDARIDCGTIETSVEARDGTVKYRVSAGGAASVEAVSMIQSGRRTLCLSSQVGCALDCDFCLTARMGLVRNLSPGEIVGQVALIQDREIGDERCNVVFMGMGEPLHNYDGVMAAFRILTDPDGFGLSSKRITVSTAGLVPGIERLAKEPVRPRLAVSLNATTDEVRSRLMPVNRAYPIARLLAACDAFAEETGDRYTFEYVLLGGVNDSPEDVARLRKILGARRAKLNLIPFNPVPGWLPYAPPPRAEILAIRDRLLDAGLRVSIRWSRGTDARAACGQLALLAEAP
jgi:23S rRNA (adenine2503-C2)-methyltransferase